MCVCVVGEGHVSIADELVCVWGGYLCAGALNRKLKFIRSLAKSSPLPS